jgi:hypothetical protein
MNFDLGNPRPTSPVEVLNALLLHVPELWGDLVVNGKVTLELDADIIYDAEEAVAFYRRESRESREAVGASAWTNGEQGCNPHHDGGSWGRAGGD